MRATAILLAAFCAFGVSAVRADSTISSVQQTLKEQGFYYGEITGAKDAETTAAIRRYQIRNGLQITGELNAETQKSLGLKSAPPSARATPAATPARPPSRPPPESSDLRDDRSPEIQEPSIAGPEDEFGTPDSSLRPEHPSVFQPQNPRALFQGTPYEMAPPELQTRVVLSAQTLLARHGYYRSGIDGVYGPGTEFAVRAYQSRFGIEPTGRLDMETLAALGLLPRQEAPGVTAPRRSIQRPRFIDPRGERIYIPR
ncbi:MAG: peptidoglycan-binding protein [Chthoniobacterales bacterium]|nr:peptidoglycan-binding protein [Chthoniobacterales bacterium]